MIQIQITQIHNGWLIGLPPEGPNQPPRMFYAPDYQSVTTFLASIWPNEGDASNIIKPG